MEHRTEEGVPSGWHRLIRRREGGNSAGTFDLYIINPSGKRFRSTNQLNAWLIETCSPHRIEEFDFSRKTINWNSVSLDSPHNTSHAGSSEDAESGPAHGGEEKKKRRKSPKTPKTPLLVDFGVRDNSDDEGRQAEEEETPKHHYRPEKKKLKMLKQDSDADVSVESGASGDFLLDKYVGDPWKFVIAAFFLEKNGKEDDPALRKFLDEFFVEYPTAEALHKAGWLATSDHIKGSGHDEMFAQLLCRYTFDFVYNDPDSPLPPHKHFGVTAYMSCCYRILVLGDLSAPTHYGRDLKAYKAAVKRRKGNAGGGGEN